jgi:Lar family restriction alleviation protein
MAETKMLPCPFCGSEHTGIRKKERDDEGSPYYAPFYCAECDACEARTRWTDSFEEAIEAWNKRPKITKDSIETV